MAKKLYQIQGPNFVAGLEADRNEVTFAAPIIKWMLGWHMAKVATYCRNQIGWRLTEVRQPAAVDEPPPKE